MYTTSFLNIRFHKVRLKIRVTGWQNHCVIHFFFFLMMRHYRFYLKHMIHHYVIHPTICLVNFTNALLAITTTIFFAFRKWLSESNDYYWSLIKAAICWQSALDFDHWQVNWFTLSLSLWTVVCDKESANWFMLSLPRTTLKREPVGASFVKNHCSKWSQYEAYDIP